MGDVSVSSRLLTDVSDLCDDARSAIAGLS